VKTTKEYLRHDFSGALVLLVVVIATIVLMTRVRLSDIDALLSRSTYAIAAAARTVLN
jgi:hypothetical protein